MHLHIHTYNDFPVFALVKMPIIKMLLAQCSMHGLHTHTHMHTCTRVAIPATIPFPNSHPAIRKQAKLEKHFNMLIGSHKAHSTHSQQSCY